MFSWVDCLLNLKRNLIRIDMNSERKFIAKSVHLSIRN